MSRLSRSTTDPALIRELDAIEAALQEEPVEPDLRDLEELVHALRAERQRPSDSFAAELDRRVARGFGRPAGAPPARRTGLPRRLRAAARGRRLMPALGAVASLLIALTVATGVWQRSQRSEEMTTPTAVPTVAAPSSQAPATEDRTSAPERGVAVPPMPPGGGEAPGRRERQVERLASLVLSAPAEEIDEVSDDAVRVVDRMGGIVISSNVRTTDEGRASASFDLRVPTARLREALAELSELAHVRSRTQSAQDVTGSFVSVQERVRESLAERQALLRQLAGADTLAETESLRARLRIVNAEISAQRRELAALRERTSFSRLSLTIVSGDEAGELDGRWTPGDALRDALRILEVIAGVALVTLAIVLPLALFGAAAAWALRRLRRRRREQALDAS